MLRLKSLCEEHFNLFLEFLSSVKDTEVQRRNRNLVAYLQRKLAFEACTS